MRLPAIALAAFTVGAAAPSTPSDLTVVKTELRKLIVAEEVYFTDHNSYTPTVSALYMKGGVNDSVTIKFVEFSPNGYAVSGTLKGTEGASCVLMIGPVSAAPKTAKGAVAKNEGETICDE